MRRQPSAPGRSVREMQPVAWNSGTLFISSEKFGVDAHNALHSFDHADGGYHLMGCMLSAASCNKWWMDEILKTTGMRGSRKRLKIWEKTGYFSCLI